MKEEQIVQEERSRCFRKILENIAPCASSSFRSYSRSRVPWSPDSSRESVVESAPSNTLIWISNECQLGGPHQQTTILSHLKDKTPMWLERGSFLSSPTQCLSSTWSGNNRKSRLCMNDSHDNSASGGQQDHSRPQFLYSLQQLGSGKTIIKPIFESRSQTQMYLTLNLQVSIQPKVESEIDGFLILFNHFHVNWFHSL